LAEMSKEELIKRFVSIEFNRFLEYYRNARPLENVAERNRRGREDDRTSRPERSDRSNRGGDRAARGPRSDRPERRDRPVGPEAGMSTFVVEGVNRDLRKGALVRVICESANIGSESIGQIAFVKGMALIDVKEGVSESVSKLDAIKLDGKNLNVRSFVRGSFSDASSGSAPRSSGSGYRSGGGSYDRDRGSDRDRSRGGRSGGSSGDRERRRR